MDKKELAVSLHNRKFNCCQSVICAFAQETGVDALTLFKMSEGFGLGMGGMECTCGAIMAAGLINSDGQLDSPATKADTYRLSRELVKRFRQKCGSTVCRELKGADTGEVLCSCQDCICNAVEAAQEVLGL